MVENFHSERSSLTHGYHHIVVVPAACGGIAPWSGVPFKNDAFDPFLDPIRVLYGNMEGGAAPLAGDLEFFPVLRDTWIGMIRPSKVSRRPKIHWVAGRCTSSRSYRLATDGGPGQRPCGPDQR